MAVYCASPIDRVVGPARGFNTRSTFRLRLKRYIQNRLNILSGLIFNVQSGRAVSRFKLNLFTQNRLNILLGLNFNPPTRAIGNSHKTETIQSLWTQNFVGSFFYLKEN